MVIVQDGAEAGLRRDGLLLSLVADVMREQRHADDDATAPAAIMRARDLIDDDPTTPVTLADLAEVSGLSRFQLLRGFAKATGLTPHAYLLQRRIHQARRLIGGVCRWLKRLLPVALPIKAI